MHHVVVGRAPAIFVTGQIRADPKPRVKQTSIAVTTSVPMISPNRRMTEKRYEGADRDAVSVVVGDVNISWHTA